MKTRVPMGVEGRRWLAGASTRMGWWMAWQLMVLVIPAAQADQPLSWRLRFEQPTSPGASRYHRLYRQETWPARQTAVIVCDMWDAHHSVNAVRRVVELAPRIDGFCRALRQRGATVIHAPSSCMGAYEGHPARVRALGTPRASDMPDDIGTWCDQIPGEEMAAYPLDQSDGGEDDDWEEHGRWAQRLEADGRNPRAPWIRQTPAIAIDPGLDYISDDGQEIWSILQHRGIDNVILVGVHTNMCVLGRPFGLRRLAAAGKNVVLARDLTDTMYDPRDWPYCNHFTGTDRIIRHIERYVCPTISSDQLLGDAPFRFRDDRRLHLVMLIAEDEYQTAETLPRFAEKHLGEHFSVSICYGSDTQRHHIVGLEEIDRADALLISVRRRALLSADMERLRRFVAAGKPVIGIRTASHAFSLRGAEPPPGHEVWDAWDAVVFGGNYTGHHANDLHPSVMLAPLAAKHPIVAAVGDGGGWTSSGSLYKVSPLQPGTGVLAYGSLADMPPEPVAWTFVRSDGGRSFYTSLGHADDFDHPEFEALLSAGIHWAAGLSPHGIDAVRAQSQRFDQGAGRQR
ncbi:MAG: isochorismatase family protein [Planctomycetota bacterium]|nr:MAG: isochorismatase family protein [Planctomycetota bacterium]